jgi:hypothetical protein
MTERLDKIKDSRIKVFNLFQESRITNIRTAKGSVKHSMDETYNRSGIGTSMMNSSYKPKASSKGKDLSNNNIFIREIQPYLNKSPFKQSASRLISIAETPIKTFKPLQRQSNKKVNKSIQLFPLDELKLFDKKIEKKKPPLTPKTKTGQIFFNNYFCEIKSSIFGRSDVKEVTKDKNPTKVNVIDCLAMDNYDRMYNNFHKYAMIFKFDKNKLKNYSQYVNKKISNEKSTLEELYSKDLIITNKFIKSQEKLICLPNIKKSMEEYKVRKSPKIHYTFNKMKEKLRNSYNS